mmetsp:Transcript_27351/g.72242  ORF Transcript_27351/g.72242 Transcript_27351/m.72242 type:complete len:104 (+) Transcript_27351:66-377(+)
MQRNSGLLFTLALLAGAAYLSLPTQDFVVPSSQSSLRGKEAAALAQGFQYEARSTSVGMMATPSGGAPSKINLLFLGVLVGSAALGILALFFYGAYSGAGSSL